MNPESISNANERQRLQEAFDQFNSISDELISAYHLLEQQVLHLNEQLAESNRKLQIQVAENAALAERLSSLLSALPAGVVELDAEGRVVRANPAVGKFLGVIPLGERWEVVSGGVEASPIAGVMHLVKHHGCEQFLTLQEQALPDQTGTLVLLHDVTRQVELTRDLNQQQKLAEMGAMAASLAHQLRTPLATAMLYTANLSRPGLSEGERGRFVDKSLARMRALEGLIQNMLSFVRGQVQLCERLPLSELVNELLGIVEPQSENAGVVLRYDFSMELSGVCVYADRKSLLGCLTNLVENAMHFSKEGQEIAILLRLHNGKIDWVIEDQGPGVPEELREKIFEPFYSGRSGGTGLGLAIVRKVAEELKGAVRCEAGTYGGARFVLTIPIA